MNDNNLEAFAVAVCMPSTVHGKLCIDNMIDVIADHPRRMLKSRLGPMAGRHCM